MTEGLREPYKLPTLYTPVQMATSLERTQNSFFGVCTMAGNCEVVSDSSPLIILAHIAGAGLPGAAQIAQADWIEV